MTTDWAPRVRAGLAVIFLASVAYAFTIRTAQDRVIIYKHAPRESVSAAHRTQVAEVLRHLSPGSPLIYIDPADEAWQAGMWQRSLYPEHHVVYRTRTAAEAKALRDRLRASGLRVAAAVVTARFLEDAGFGRTLPLRPDDPAGAPLMLGLWDDEPSNR